MAVPPSKAGTVLCCEGDVAEGVARGFLPDATALRYVIITRRQGKLYGWLDNCPHYPGGTPMAWRRDAYLDGSGDFIACHAHGAIFDIETGECLSGPCVGQSLVPVLLKVRPDGQVSLTTDIDWTGVTA